MAIQLTTDNQAMNETDIHATEKLVMCDVKSPDGSLSKRLIELEHFKLWHELAKQKHNLSVENITVCLWFSEDDSANRKSIFAHANHMYEVNKISIALYDPVNHFSHTINRYALMEDTNMLKKKLLTHMSDEVASKELYEMQVIPGFCVTQQLSLAQESILLGLSKGI